MGEISKTLTLEDRNLIRECYSLHMPSLVGGIRVDPYSIFPFNIVDYMTPIERNVWFYYRQTNQIMYPQVPCGKYFIDFADPSIGLALEVDGAEWHTDFESDMIRQEYIMSQGYTDFRRIQGKDTYHLEYDEDYYEYEFTYSLDT